MKRSRVSISLDSDVIDWINSQIDDGKFYNVSHAFESIVKEKMNSE